MSNSEFTMAGKVETDLPPFVETIHPISGAPVLARNPALQIVNHQTTKVKCNDAASFAATVLALSVSMNATNRLIEFRADGSFVYRDALGAMMIHSASFELAEAPTASILCLSVPKSFSQQKLVQWCAQWPGTLTPLHDQPAAVIEHIGNYAIKSTTDFSAVHGEKTVSLSATREKTAVGMELPTYWTAISPVYHGGAEQEVKLRLEMQDPKINDEGKVVGDLVFTFNLWTPDAEAVSHAAMLDACETMGELLPDFTIIRGTIS